MRSVWRDGESRAVKTPCGSSITARHSSSPRRQEPPSKSRPALVCVPWGAVEMRISLPGAYGAVDAPVRLGPELIYNHFSTFLGESALTDNDPP